jgi:ATP-dependent Clp protease protease subunit
MANRDTRLEDDDPEGEGHEECGAAKPPRGLAMKLLDARKLIIGEAIEAKTAHRVLAELLYLQAKDPKAPVEVYINSPGGEISSGLAIYDALRHVRLPVTTIAAGLTASIATIIFVAAPKGSRKSLPNARFLIHQPLAGFRGSATDLEIQTKEILRSRQHVNGILSRATGHPMEKIDKDTNRDYWMTAEEAQEYGLVDAILRPEGE